MGNLLYWIWLSLACTPGSHTFASLITKFSSAEEIYEADEYSLRGVIGNRITDRSALLKKDLTKAEEVLDFCKKKQVGIVTYGDSRYPDLLRTIPNPPVLLYYRGVWQDFNSGSFFVSIVGTRWISEYGRKNTFVVARDLARAGAVVVSGMAKGIDGIAMAGAISSGAPTVAVIGSGIDICYPSQHITLAREIVKNGCVITEYAPGTPPHKANFPKRNRIISGLSRATLVMEGNEKSGALITARCASEQKRDVYAFPGNVGNPSSAGTNLLLKNGAKAFVCADDIVRDYENEFPGRLNPFKLAEQAPFDMKAELSRLKICAVAPSDDIFNSKPERLVKTKESRTPTLKVAAEAPTPPKAEPQPNFDNLTLSVYNRIPVEGEILIESLLDEKTDLRSLMKALLKLEMGNFVRMLPGEKVMRNL